MSGHLEEMTFKLRTGGKKEASHVRSQAEKMVYGKATRKGGV
jgi:hypothetical protein